MKVGLYRRDGLQGVYRRVDREDGNVAFARVQEDGRGWPGGGSILVAPREEVGVRWLLVAEAEVSGAEPVKG